MAIQHDYLTVYEAAERCRVKHDAVRRAIRKGELPATKPFTRVLIRQEDLDRYVREHRIEPCAEIEFAHPSPAAPKDGSFRALMGETEREPE